MSDATLVAQEIQDLSSAVGEVAQVLRDKPEQPIVVNVPESPAPSVTVNVPQQAAPNVQVDVAAPNVQVDSQVVVPPSPPNAYEVRITERDRNGYIQAFVITPLAR